MARKSLVKKPVPAPIGWDYGYDVTLAAKEKGYTPVVFDGKTYWTDGERVFDWHSDRSRMNFWYFKSYDEMFIKAVEMGLGYNRRMGWYFFPEDKGGSVAYWLDKAKTFVNPAVPNWETYEQMLAGMDWYSHYSDDASVWAGGESAMKKLSAQYDALAMLDKARADALWNKYAPQE